MKQAYPMDVARRFSVDFDALLAPVPDGDDGQDRAGAGVSLRYEPVYARIRGARHQDDATLPMGEWERPLVKADWKSVARFCTEALATRSKDFQLAAWLCEAWTHLHGVEGLIEGTRLTMGLAQRYWQHAWPELEPGDADARVAPFVWLNETLARVLTLDLPLLTIEDREPEYVCLDEWQHIIAGGVAQEEGAELTRELLARHVNTPGNLEAVIALHQHLDTARAMWNALNAQLDDLLGHDAPHLGRVTDTLARLARASTSLVGDLAQPAPAAVSVVSAVSAVSAVSTVSSHAALTTAHHVAQEIAMNAVLHEHTAMPAARAAVDAAPSSGVESREHAYQLLELVAAYLAEHEPHSPTPFLLRRAVAWGNMPLPELMREVMSREGGLSPYLNMLGIE